MSFSSHHRQDQVSSENDLPEQLDRLLEGTGVEAADTAGKITFAGCDPLFPSAVRLGSVFCLSAMAAAVGAAAIWRMRSGQGQDLFIDLRRATQGIGDLRWTNKEHLQYVMFLLWSFLRCIPNVAGNHDDPKLA
jgi:hypothetical protein